MGISKKKKKEEKFKLTRAGAKYTYTTNGHPVVLMPENVGPSKSCSGQVLDFRKPRRRRHLAALRRHRTSFDLTNQVIVFFEPDGSGRCEVVGGSGATGGDEESATAGRAVDTNRKGRPKGSKNKSSTASSSSSLSGSFNYRCEKRSLTYKFAGPVKCKSCDRTFDGDPVVHCQEYHKSVCPICGRTYRPPLTTHIKSHGTRHVLLTVSCYECYVCKEKFGNAPTMAEHLRTEHQDVVAAAAAAAACSLCTADTTAAFDTVETAVDHLVNAHCPRKKFSHPTVYRCRVCLAGFKSQINVLRHACNKIKSPHCAQCGKTFPSKMRYAFHLQFHEHPKWATMHLHCDICLAEFDDEYQLYDHIRFRHELHDKAVCEVCGRTFKSSMGLNIHRRYHNGSRDFACESCDKSFLNKSTLREHEISHMDIKPFQCHICGQYLSRASRLRSHVKTHRAAESTDQLCYSCGQCGYVAPNPNAVAEHSGKQHCEETADSMANECYALQLTSVVKCEYCDSTYLTSSHLNNHREAAHAGGGAGNAEPFICVVCSSAFSTYSRLTTHKLTHGINMESTCGAPVQQPDYQDDLSQSVSLQDDSMSDRFEIPQFFSCEYCSKKCLHYTYFCLHRRLKHPPDVQSHTCDTCSVDFKTSWRLSYHRKTVHGQPAEEKPAEKYNCTVCSRQFVKIGALNLHKTRTHIDVVGNNVCKYLCHLCGKFFSSEFSLKAHVKTHDFGAGGALAPVLQQMPVLDGCSIDVRDNRRDCSEPAATAPPPPPQTVQTRPNNQRRTNRKPSVTRVKKLCPYCSQTIDDGAAFIEHVKGHIRYCNTVLPASTVCELCDASFRDATQLKYHLDDHVKANQALLCQACYSPFLSSAAHDAHVATECSSVSMLVNTGIAPKINFVVPSTASPDVKFVNPSTAPADVNFVGPSTAPPDVNFVNSSTAPLDVMFVGLPASQEPDARPLIVDCSEIFGNNNSICTDDSSSPQKSAELPIAPIADDNNNRSLELSVIDELLSIFSTPRSSSRLDSIDYQPPDDMSFDAIFNGIYNPAD